MLEQFLVTQLFAFLLVFCRLGAAMMLLPGFGEAYVPVRVRLMMALLFSLIVAPIVQLPPVPESGFGLLTLVLAEVTIGIFMGGLSRLLVAAIHMGGMVIAYQSSLASALTQDLTQSQTQGTSLGNLLGLTALLLLFATDLHHVMLRGLADSYTLFFPGQFPNVGDFAEHASKTMNGAFHMAMQLAAPHLIIGLVIYLAAGIISRLMPNIQVFFILMAPQLLISFFILMICFSAMMMWYMDYFKTSLAAFLAP